MFERPEFPYNEDIDIPDIDDRPWDDEEPDDDEDENKAWKIKRTRGD